MGVRQEEEVKTRLLNETKKRLLHFPRGETIMFKHITQMQRYPCGGEVIARRSFETGKIIFICRKCGIKFFEE